MKAPQKVSKLRQMRSISGLTQRDLAQVSGVVQSVIAAQEKTGVRTIRVAKRYARVLNCNPLDLIEL